MSTEYYTTPSIQINGLFFKLLDGIHIVSRSIATDLHLLHVHTFCVTEPREVRPMSYVDISSEAM